MFMLLEGGGLSCYLFTTRGCVGVNNYINDGMFSITPTMSLHCFLFVLHITPTMSLHCFLFVFCRRELKPEGWISPLPSLLRVRALRARLERPHRTKRGTPHPMSLQNTWACTGQPTRTRRQAGHK